MRYRATIPGTDNVLIGDGYERWSDAAPRVGGGMTIGASVTRLPLFDADGWQVEPIIELPTNKHAIVLIDGVAYWRGESNLAEYVWSDNDGGDWWTHEYVARQWERADNFDIVFEGIAPEDTGL